MRKLIFTTLLAVFAFTTYAQSIDDIKDLVGKQQWDKAKDQIDKYLANEKNAKKADGWFYKGVIYNEIGKSDKYKSLVTGDARMEAFNSLKKYIELDPKNILGTIEQNVRFFDIYNGYFDLAANSFNSKNYDVAYENFKNANMVEDYVASKGFSYNNFSFPKLDTSLLQNTGVSALMAKKTDDAVIYYQKLADAKVTGKSYLEIYQFLVQYYNDKGDKVNRDKYLALGRELYPEDDYWVEAELKDAGTDKQKLYAKYDELIQRYPTKYLIHYNYAAELFNYLFTQDKKPADYGAVYTKLQDVLKKAIAIKPTPEANLLAARTVYNGIYDLEDASNAIKCTKPDDVKKKNDLKTQIAARFEEMQPYAQSAFDPYAAKSSLKPGEKGNYKVATDLLTRYWESKKNAEKVKFYQDKMKDTN
ncbi:MAG: hypothetical protein ABUT20_21065 [Bacteroidota bacterium]